MGANRRRIRALTQAKLVDLHWNYKCATIFRITMSGSALKARGRGDIHPADLIAALHKAGTSLRRLARANGIAESTLRNALRRSYPKAEQILARALGLSPAALWPNRQAARERRRARRRERDGAPQ